MKPFNWREARFWLLLVLLFALGSGIWLLQQSRPVTHSPVALLTNDELAWLQQHPVLRLAPDPNFPPLEYFDETGHYRGLIADYYPLIESLLGVRFEIVRAATWDEVLAMARRREVDILGGAQQTPARDEYLNFSQTLIDIPNVIIVPMQTGGQVDFSRLAGKRLAITRGNALDEYVRANFPAVRIVAVADDLAGLRDVSFGRADATVVNLAIASYLIDQHGISNLRVAGDSGRSNALHIASRNDWPILNRILSKGLAAVTEAERQAIYRRWIRLDDPLPGRESLIALFATAAFFILVVIVVLLINRSLRRQVEARTATLNQDLVELKQAEVEIKALNEVLVGLIKRQREAEDALRQSMEVFEAIQFSITETILLLDPKGKVLAANPTAAQRLGKTPKEIVGRNLYSLFPPEVADIRRGFVDRVIRTRKPLTTDDARNGRAYFATYYPVLSSLGEVSAVAVIATDVTEMKQAQQLELALHNISEASHAALDLPGLLERIHQIIEELMPARNFFVAVYDEINQEISFPYFVDEHDPAPLPRKIGEGGLTEAVLKSGETLLLSADMPESGRREEPRAAGTPSLDWLGVPLRNENRTVGVLAVQSYSGLVRYTDKDKALLQFVSDQVAMAIQRMRAYSRLQLAANVFTYAQEGITISDAAGNIIEVNDTFTRITGYSRAEVIGKNPRILKSGRHGPEFYAVMWSDLKTKGHWYGEIWNRRKNGDVFAEMLNISAVCDANGLPQHYVALFSDITSLKEHQSQLERIAHYDALTGLPNRVVLADRLRQATAQTRRRENLMALVYLDLDGFKAVNDSHGHETGDELLIILSQRLKEALREGDTLARIGGDEFVAVLTDLATPQECQVVLSRLLQAAATPVQIKEHSLRVSASLGVTLFPLDSGDPDTLLRHADQAMYQAKQVGKNRYHFFDPERDQQVRTHHEDFQRITQAYQREEFVLHYQPKVNMRKGEVIGAEALIRWQHPERGLIPPGEFLPLIEESELISKVGDWVLDTALAQMAAWCRQGLEIAVSVNIAAFHLQQDDFLLRLREKLAAHPELKAENLELEVLETAALEDILRVSQVIKDCQALGVNVSLDDFGTGYSSLTYLKRLPATVLKIDQSFVRDMLWDAEDLAIIEGVIGLAAAFHRVVIAEGVETAQHGQMLLKLGCDLGQGYGIARPMSVARLPEWVQQWRPDPGWADCGDAAVNRDELPLVHAEVDHRYWVKWLDNFLADLSDNPPTFDSRLCRFGAWYHGEGRSHYGHMPEFQVIDTIHEQVHQLGRELLAHKSAARIAEAQAGMAELNLLRDALIGQLHALAAAMGKNRIGLQTRQEGQS